MTTFLKYVLREILNLPKSKGFKNNNDNNKFVIKQCCCQNEKYNLVVIIFYKNPEVKNETIKSETSVVHHKLELFYYYC